jgi:hypothetical protein
MKFSTNSFIWLSPINPLLSGIQISNIDRMRQEDIMDLACGTGTMLVIVARGIERGSKDDFKI